MFKSIRILNRIVKRFNTTFDCSFNTLRTKDNKRVLNDYIDMGIKLQKNQSPHIQNLDNAIKDDSILLKEADGFDEEYKATLNETFIALVAPRLSGKTQSAFAVKSKAPLYFAFDSTQPLYEPFKKLSENLKSFAAADIAVMESELKPARSAEIPYIDQSEFEKLKHIKSKVVGYLIALMEDAETCESKSTDWFMHFTRNRKIQFNEASINDFQVHALKEKFMKNYFVFMDDFVGCKELIYVRNLLRYLNISCVVASSNAKILKYLDNASNISYSPRAWCLTFTNFAPITAESIERSFQRLNSEIDYARHLRQRNNEDDEVSDETESDSENEKHFLEYLKTTCLESRPGLVDYIMKISQSRLAHHYVNFTLYYYNFRELLSKVNDFVRTKKDEDYLDRTRYLAPLLMMTGDFFDATKARHASLLNEKFFIDLIDNSVFSLCNPKPNGDPFLLSQHVFEKDVLEAGLKDKIKDVSLSYGREFERFKITSHFNVKETHLLLSILNLSLPGYVGKHFKDYFNASKQSDMHEKMPFLCIADASHESSQLIRFLEEVLHNFNTDICSPKIVINVEDKIIENTVRRFVIPFLFPLNMKMPESFEKMFPRGKSNYGEFFVNDDQVDGVFDLTSPSESSQKIGRCIVEAKNYKSELKEPEFVQIIKKALDYSKINSENTEYPLHLTFASSIKDLKKAFK